MDRTEPTSIISLVTKREPVLRAVGTDGRGKRELVDRLPISRSTIDRGIRELESVGLLVRTTEGYRRTLFGELLLTEYDQFTSKTEALLNGQEVLADLAPEFDLDTVLFEDASVVMTSQYAPHQPISALCSLLDDARWTQTVFPAVFPQVFDRWTTLGEDESIRDDIVLTDPVVSELVGSHSETLQQLLSEPRLSLHQVADGLDYGLVVAEGESTATAGLVVIDRYGGGARALVTTDAPKAVSWVRERINTQLTQSTPLSAPSVE